jgi:hypothetical protein
MQPLRNILLRPSGHVATDLGADAVRLLAMEDGVIRTAVAIPAPFGSDGGGWTAGLSSAVRAASLRGRECRVTLPSRLFRMEVTSMPPMSEPDRARSARFEAMDRFGVDPDTAVIRHVPIGTDARQVLLMAADGATLGSAVGPMVEAGLLPCSVEPAAWAALRGAMAFAGLGDSGRVAFVSLEPELACVTLLQDGVIVSFRCVHGHWGQATAGTMHRHAVAEAELALEGDDESWKWSALAEEMVRALRGNGGEQAWPERLVLTGSGTDEASLRSTLSGVCGVPVVSAQSGAWASGAPVPSGDLWAPAFGSMVLDGPLGIRRAA